MTPANDNGRTNCRLKSRPLRPGERELSTRERAEIIERLEDEFDLLCLGRPEAWRIDAALRQASQSREVH